MKKSSKSKPSDQTAGGGVEIHSPTDSGIDTRDWDEINKGPRLTLDPYDYGAESAWASVGGRDQSEAKRRQTQVVVFRPSLKKIASLNQQLLIGREKRNDRPSSHMMNGTIPNGTPGGSPKPGTAKDASANDIKKYASSQSSARTNFLLEHLASFTMKESQDATVSPRERLSQTKELLAKGTLWTKEMEMRLTDNDLILLDGETQDVIEVYPLSTVGLVQNLTEDSDLNNVLAFSTLQTDDKFAAMHLFQSDKVPAAVVATEIMKASSSKEAMPHKYSGRGGIELPPPPSYAAPTPPKDNLGLHERSLVAQTIAAFSNASQESNKQIPKGVSKVDERLDESLMSSEMIEAKTNRDVQILNHCIDDIETLVLKTKKSAEAWKKLQKKKSKKKADPDLAMEARPPPEADFIDAFQKFKHAFNLLGKLRNNIHHPNASELAHYLFVPLSLLVRCTGGPQKAGSVVSPLLTFPAIELLQNCLSSKETEFWMSLGPTWNQPKSSKHFKDTFIPPYAPVFKDGWVPPEYLGGKEGGVGMSVPANISQAVAANAAAVAQLVQGEDGRKANDPGVNLNNPSVLAAAAKFKKLASAKNELSASAASDSPAFAPSPSLCHSEDDYMFYLFPKDKLHDSLWSVERGPAKKKTSIFRRVYVLYDFTQRNSKELSVKQGEELQVLDDSRQWWCVRNSQGSIGFIPYTIVDDVPGTSEKRKSIPLPPSTAPPPVPVTTNHGNHISTTTVVTKSNSDIERQSSVDGSKATRVELRRVDMTSSVATSSKDETVVKPAGPIPPPPPTSPPPPSPTQTLTKEKDKKDSMPKDSDMLRAIKEGRTLKKVDLEEEKRRREESKHKRMSSADLLTDELKRRMTSPNGTVTPKPFRREATQVVNLNYDSTASEVTDWLKSKNFSTNCIQVLGWRSAKQLEKFSKDDLKKLCGDAEGARVFSQFSVQKANWQTSKKGSEFMHIMRRRKEMVDVKKEVSDPKEPSKEEGKLRSIVAEARGAASKDDLPQKEAKTPPPVRRQGPSPKPRPKSMFELVPPPSPPEATKNHSSSESEEREDRSTNKPRTFSSGSAFDLPPPLTEDEQQESQQKRNSMLTEEQVEDILNEQKKQNDLLREHERQLALIERLQRQKLELQHYKQDFEAHMRKQEEEAMQKRKDELETQIRSQQDELRLNQEKLEQQKRLLANYELLQQQINLNRLSGSHQFGMMPASFVPGMPAMPPLYPTGYPGHPGFGAATLPAMIPRVGSTDSTYNPGSTTQM